MLTIYLHFLIYILNILPKDYNYFLVHKDDIPPDFYKKSDVTKTDSKKTGNTNGETEQIETSVIQEQPNNSSNRKKLHYQKKPHDKPMETDAKLGYCIHYNTNKT